MQIAGKVIGASLGLFLGGGPVGLIIGVIVGHAYDRIAQGPAAQPFMSHMNQRGLLQETFFDALFLTMGKLAKADGRVSENEISTAREVMNRMGLSDSQRQHAIDLFNQGKESEFNLETPLSHLREVIGRRPTLIQIFLEIQLQVAYSDGQLSSHERSVLQQVCRFLNVNKFQFEAINQRVYAQYQFSRSQYQRNASSNQSSGVSVEKAYGVLGVKSSVNDAELKKAYRRLMSQHHPDKLVAKGLPTEMTELAKEKTQEIQQAYELIKNVRKANR